MGNRFKDIERYEVFIAFKHLDEDGKETPDSILADKVFYYLTERGLKVFNSNISLERHGISEYKKSIDKALEMAKVLVVIGTSVENLNSDWVRYEWDSFFNDILCKIKPEGRIFSYIDGLSPKDLPRALRQNQCIIHNNESLERLYFFIKNALNISEKAFNKQDKIGTAIKNDITFLLKKISGEGPQSIAIPFDQPISIGKNRKNDVVLSEKGVSRNHARIVHNKEGLFVFDLESTNGTYVNTVKIKTKELLKKSDIVEFDIVKYKVAFLNEEK